MAIARLNNVTLRYDSTVALADLSLEVAQGEWLCVLGANGSGKSTLASVVAGLLAPDEGDVELAGEQVLTHGQVDAGAYRAARHKLSLVFQNPDDQIVTTVVADDIAFGPENLGVEPEEIGHRVERELKRVAMQPYALADPTRLSGGQKQRVAIAGALAMEPELLVLDEPGALLDVRGREAILRVMRRLHEAGTALVHITHFMDEALAADRVVVLDKGRIVLEGNPGEVFSHARTLRELGLEEPFAAQLCERLERAGMHVPWTCDENELARELQRRYGNKEESKPAQRPSSNMAPRSPSADTSGQTPAPIVNVSHVSYTYRGSNGGLALDDVSLTVPDGEHVAIVGHTGSGKSTLLRLLCALEVPDVGEIVVDGVSTAKKRNRRLLHGRVGYVMQHPERQLFANSVYDDVAYGPRNMGLNGDELNSRVNGSLALVGLGRKAQASPFELSGGQQRLCAIAGVLAMEPRVLVLDEPTAGLDPKGRAQLRSILTSILHQGVTLVEVTHSMESAARCDRVVVLNEGRVLAEGAPEQVFSHGNKERLTNCGLGLPWPLAFAERLEGNGLGAPLTLDELAEALCRADADVPAANAAETPAEAAAILSNQPAAPRGGEL